MFNIEFGMVYYAIAGRYRKTGWSTPLLQEIDEFAKHVLREASREEAEAEWTRRRKQAQAKS